VTSAHAADQYRRRQVLISATLSRDVVRLLKNLFNPANPGPSWAAARSVVAALVHDQRRRSTDLATRFYQDARRSAGVAGDFTPAIPVELEDQRLLKSLDATGIATYEKSLRAGASPEKAADRSAVTLSGSASNLALEGGRSVIDESVQDDDEAIGWARVTDSDPCPWCLMMASRGATYHSAATAGKEKDSHFIGDGDFKWHNHCGCAAVPVWDLDDPVLKTADDLYDKWLQVTAGHSGQAAINAWRRYWKNPDGQPAR
jgi:hypothetical protein